jgi:hypothetical protein
MKLADCAVNGIYQTHHYYGQLSYGMIESPAIKGRGESGKRKSRIPTTMNSIILFQ